MYQGSETSGVPLAFTIQSSTAPIQERVDVGARRTAAAFLSRYLLIEFLAIWDSAYLSGHIYNKVIWSSWTTDGAYAVSALLVAAGILTVSMSFGHFNWFQMQSRHRVMWNGAAAVVITFSFFLSGIFLLKVGSDYSRVTFLLQLFAIVAIVLAVRAYAHVELRSAIWQGRVAARRAVIVGNVDQVIARRLAEAGVKITHCLPFPVGAPEASEQSKRTDLRHIIDACRGIRPDDVVILTKLADLAISSRVADVLSELPVSIHLVPTGTERLLGSAKLGELGALVTFELFRPPLNAFDAALKRLFDVTTACVGLVVLTPILLFVAALIKLDSPGPILFRQIRHGYNNEAIRVFKLRTMRTVERGYEFTQAQKNDSRVTRVGRILRRTNIDEFPQLLNVLAGDMSIVGPRPHPIAMNVHFDQLISPLSRRHNVKPGITGWAQVNGYRGETDTLEKMQRRVECDLYYIDNWSFLLDLRIIFLTLFSKTAYFNAF